MVRKAELLLPVSYFHGLLPSIVVDHSLPWSPVSGNCFADAGLNVLDHVAGLGKRERGCDDLAVGGAMGCPTGLGSGHHAGQSRRLLLLLLLWDQFGDEVPLSVWAIELLRSEASFAAELSRLDFTMRVPKDGRIE